MSIKLSRGVLIGAAALAAVASSGLAPGAALRASGAVPPVVVTGVAVNNSSAKIDFLPVAGARDYRIFDVSNPTVVKYAGMIHLDAGPAYHFVMQPDGVTPVYPYTSTLDSFAAWRPQTLNVPGTEIEWNMLGDDQPHTLLVQAVDALGPAPPHNLYDVNTNPTDAPAGLLGSNEGPTPDGNVSINGQGPSTDAPHVIAQSAPFVVQANPAVVPIPSRPDATQTFFDSFDDSENASLQRVGPVNPSTGVMTYTLNAGTPRAWNIVYHGADTDHSVPMVEDGHFMDVLFDGQTPSSLPWYLHSLEHVQYTNMSMTPQASADLSNGALLHLTQEVDGHLDQTFRWLAWQLAPANDPITNFKADDQITNGGTDNSGSPINQSDKALWVQVFAHFCDAMLFEGPASSTNPAPHTNAFVPVTLGKVPACVRMSHWGGNGRGLDNRERWDLFLTTRHIALFEDGQLLMQSDIPDGGLPFTQAKLYFTHYLYPTGLEHLLLPGMEPWETYWLNEFPYSDERHWDNMGFEVLPASAVPANDDFSSLAALIHLPAPSAPQYAQP